MTAGLAGAGAAVTAGLTRVAAGAGPGIDVGLADGSVGAVGVYNKEGAVVLLQASKEIKNGEQIN